MPATAEACATPRGVPCPCGAPRLISVTCGVSIVRQRYPRVSRVKSGGRGICVPLWGELWPPAGALSQTRGALDPSRPRGRAHDPGAVRDEPDDVVRRRAGREDL